MTTTSLVPGLADADPATEVRADLFVQGMTCAGCVRRVERALEQTDGVKGASVNFALGRASVTYDPARASGAALAAAVARAGYEVIGAPGGAPAEAGAASGPREPGAPAEPAVAPERATVDLDVLGMTCSGCVRRVEKALRAAPGVREASVNLALDRATVAYDRSSTSPVALADAIRGAGYDVPSLPEAAAPATPAFGARPVAEGRAAVLERAERSERRSIRRDFAVAAALSAPLLVVAMAHGAIPGTEGPFGRWLQFALAAPVVFGPGRRFFRLAWAALRHGAADMNTLVALGAGAAWLYSTVALVAPGLFPHAEHGAMPHLYFEAAAAIVTFVLLGKLLETRARRRLADAVRGLVAL